MVSGSFGRGFSTSSAAAPTDAESQMTALLTRELSAEFVAVEDVSGGCGAMYRVTVVSSKFDGKPLIQQHRLVTETLKKEIGGMHGLTITTFTPAKWKKVVEEAGGH